MGVYIKGMKMPKNCAACIIEDKDLETFWYTCPLIKKWDVGGARSAFTNDVRYKGRREDCPLVEVAEPHGRLIDADKIKATCGDWYTEEGTEEGFIGTVGNLIDLIPAVVEAEGAEE